MEARSVPGARPELLPKHTIFLSHSGNEKAFVEQLCADLERAHHSPFFDQNSESIQPGEKFPGLIAAAARQCLVAVIVLSPGYLESRWPMKELIAFVQSREKGNPVKLLPLFYKLTPEKLRDASWRKHWRTMIETNEEKLVINEQLCIDAIRELKNHNGLRFEKYGDSEMKYREDVVVDICELLPPAMPFDTSDIQGCDRLCEAISSKFMEKDGIGYLGLHGMPGLGKSRLCCEAMCNYFQEVFRGRFCVVKLESDKAADGIAAAKMREDRLRDAIKQLLGVHKSMSAITSESQGHQFLKDRVHSQRVFLVVDNVSQSSREEAEFYVNEVGFGLASKVLVTSRSKKILESLLGGPQYCQPFPGLEKEEASQLFLSKAARSRLDSHLEPDELQILEDCVDVCYIDEQYHPVQLISLANILQGRGEDDILSWRPLLEKAAKASREAGDIFRLLLVEYEMLDKTSRLIFLDLAIFADGMCYTHMDFHGELEWDERSNFTHVVTYIAMLHKINPKFADMKVKELQRKSFLKESDTEISVPDFCIVFARWLIKANGDREEKDWCTICKPEEKEDDEEEDEERELSRFESANLPSVFPSTLVRVRLSSVFLVDSDQQKIRQWGHVMYLELKLVKVRSLDLHGLNSLRVLRVEECDGLEEIVCRCNSSSSGGPFCYQNQQPSGCMPELRVVQLEFLPKLKYALFPVHCWNLETVWFFHCPNLSCLPDLRFCKKLKRLRLPCGDFRKFQGLRSNKALTELAFHWDPETVRNFTTHMREKLLHDVMNLANLKILDIVDEHKVYDWIPAGICLNVGKLVLLTFLDLSYATTVEEVEGLEELSHLTSLGLYGCCELRMLPDLTVFRNLKRLCISHCPKLALSSYDVPEEVKDFHPLGERCSFGEHECLLPESSTISATQRQDDTCDNSLNILLLGETGVDKSMFINALCNYLIFPTLDEALDGELQNPKYCDKGANHKDAGSSCTQKCKAYTFPIGDRKLIRLVDTPGIGDTRDFDQDVKNIKGILSFISRYEGLNAICILLKPNEDRPSTSSKYWFLELLTHLHKDASSNILFCFTNSRSTMFPVLGVTKSLLKGMMSHSPQTAAIKLDTSTMYHFDSEGSRFLASVKNGVSFSKSETETFRSSWRQSTDEASRLIQHIASLTPLDTLNMLSLNCMRDMLAALEIPLAKILAVIQEQLDETSKITKEVYENLANSVDNPKSMFCIKENVNWGHLRTICTRPSCEGVICHDNCSPTERLGGVVGGVLRPDRIFCNRLSVLKGKCKTCSCPNDAHIRVSHKKRTLVCEREDKNIQRMINETRGEYQMNLNEISMMHKQQEESIKDEMKVVVKAAALFAGFVAQNSIITYHAAAKEYLIEQIKMKKHCDDRNTTDGKARIAELESLFDSYERHVQNFTIRSGSCSGRLQRITTEDVKEELDKLCALPKNGQRFKISMDDVEREYNRGAIKREEVAYKPREPINQAASTSRHGGGWGFTDMIQL